MKPRHQLAQLLQRLRQRLRLRPASHRRRTIGRNSQSESCRYTYFSAWPKNCASRVYFPSSREALPLPSDQGFQGGRWSSHPLRAGQSRPRHAKSCRQIYRGPEVHSSPTRVTGFPPHAVPAPCASEQPSYKFDPGRRTSERNSFRVCICVLKTPSIAEVTVDECCFSTPRIIMQRCCASRITATPCG